jgi:hypothetical protein
MKKKAKKSKAKTKAKAKPKARKKLSARLKKPAKKSAGKKGKKASKAKAKGRAKKPAMSVTPPEGGVLIGRVEDYFAQIGVIAFTLKKPLQVGDHIHILGHTTDQEQVVASMQIDHQTVTVAKPKDAIGIKVGDRARRGDYIFIVPA